jgi:3-dehydroquinate synthase
MHIDLGVASYEVQIGSNLIRGLVTDLLKDQTNNVIIIDESVTGFFRSNCKDFDQLNVIELTAGKESKSIFSLTKIFSALEQINLSRSGEIIAIGGGVIGDIAGLAASLWYRGCGLIHVPTTLLASVDSCVGGKTAVNFNGTINAIGSYYHPSKIIIDINLLKKLPTRELKSGLAEVIKYSILGNNNITTMLNNHSYDEIVRFDNLKKLINFCLLQKNEFVVGDVREENKRLFLNFGHTIGHAFEINSVVDGREQLRHGEGVALGMIAISKVAVEVGLLPETEFQKIQNLIKKFGLPTTVHPELFACNRDLLIEKCITSTFKDKKRTSEGLRLILPTSSIGECKIYFTKSEELIRTGIDFVFEDEK